MQKVLQRTAMAKRQAVRKAALKAKHQEYLERLNYRAQVESRAKVANETVKQARRAQREDWEYGPLAPRRDVGDDKEKFGTVESSQVFKVPPPKKDAVNQWHVFKGDRVVILKGRDKGKIGEVSSINKENDTVTVQGLNLADVYVPEWQRKADRNPSPYRTLEIPLHYNDVRLVYPVPDPKTGIPRDVVVSRVKLLRDQNGDPELRIIPGMNVGIPVPESAKQKPELREYDNDTLRITVEETTWVPTLLIPPMPETVIDELRNKYSRYRTRHDEEWMEMKMKQDEEAEKLRNAVTMRTPLQEFHLRQRQAAANREPPEPTEDLLAQIGEMMAKSKGLGGAQAESL